ncbi:MAG TPA: lysophospholipid acyltransferase family protein [Pyrinomonadaceae bacterium]
MTRRIITAVLRLALRVFFRHIEVAGLERVPLDRPVIFVLNHPNGLVDPVFLLCLAPRSVSFLAKAPLFRMPVISSLVRALDSLPVYRRQDKGSDPARNRETFEAACALLARGGTIAICPEGVSHNDTQLKPLKTGAARIALGAASSGAGLDVRIVPAGLYYTAKKTFRSNALLYFGEPLTVEPVVLKEDGDPPREAVHALSNRIRDALLKITLNVEHEEPLQLIDRAEKIYSAEEQSSLRAPDLKRELMLRRRFVEGYAFHRVHQPERLAALDARLRRYEEELKQAGLDPHKLSPPTSTRAVVRHLIERLAVFLLLLPLALLGTIVHYPVYWLSGFLVTGIIKAEDDVVSTFKIIAAMLLFPLTWIGVAVLCFRWLGWPIALASLFVVPVSGFVAIRFAEEWENFIGGAKAVIYFIKRRWFFKRLLVERRVIREEIEALGNEAERSRIDAVEIS